MRKYEPPYIHKKFLFICYTTTERILKICPVPYKHHLDLDKLKTLIK